MSAQDLATLARECGGLRGGSFEAVKTWEFTEEGLQKFAKGLQTDSFPTSPWAPTEQQLAALARLWAVGQYGDCSGEVVCAKLLLSLYNGRRFQFDLTDLRSLDDSLLRCALLVLEMDARPRREVHELLGQIYGHPRGNFGREFEWRAFELGLKGRAKKDQLGPRSGLVTVERKR